MSRSTNSSGPFGRGTWTTRIFAIANSNIVCPELVLADIPRIPGGCESMIIPSGIFDKVEPPCGAMKDGRNRQLIALRRCALLRSHLGAPLPSFACLSAFRTSRWSR
jgi:hypothetical protein